MPLFTALEPWDEKETSRSLVVQREEKLWGNPEKFEVLVCAGLDFGSGNNWNLRYSKPTIPFECICNCKCLKSDALKRMSCFCAYQVVANYSLPNWVKTSRLAVILHLDGLRTGISEHDAGTWSNNPLPDHICQALMERKAFACLETKLFGAHWRNKWLFFTHIIRTVKPKLLTDVVLYMQAVMFLAFQQLHFELQSFRPWTKPAGKEYCEKVWSKKSSCNKILSLC
jgi:hypothetical protein